jgi:hypothetical protein
VASLHDEVEQFFQRYASAAESMDVSDLAVLHNAPCLKVHGDGRIECLPTQEAVRAFFENWRASMKRVIMAAGGMSILRSPQSARLPRSRH